MALESDVTRNLGRSISNDAIEPQFNSKRAERLAQWALEKPISLGLASLCLVQLIFWIPHYLTWPWWSDHDVFATLAQGWDQGRLPYRHLRSNNFPGTIYVFWLLGRAVSFGKTWSFYAFDVTLVLCFGLLLLTWSRHQFDRYLPGLVAYAAFLSYYLGLDYTVAAQRDWHAIFFVVSALLLNEMFPNALGVVASAFLTALAFLFRPQTILLWPVLAWKSSLSGNEDTVDNLTERSPRLGFVSLWSICLIGFLLVGFAPLLLNGLLPDFLAGIRTVGFGSDYYQVTLASFVREFLRQLVLADLVIIIGLLLMTAFATKSQQTSIRTWLVAFLLVLFYKPISPIQHVYLEHPLRVIMSVEIALLVGLILRSNQSQETLRFVAVLLVLGLTIQFRPSQTSLSRSFQAFEILARGEIPSLPPLGYQSNIGVPLSNRYPWADYGDLLLYLRSETPKDTRLANLLLAVPAITGPSARPTALPAESIAWLFMVRPGDEGEFAEKLEKDQEAIVIWSPIELEHMENFHKNFNIDRLKSVVLNHFQLDRRFGTIEVWRSKPPVRAMRPN